MPFQSEKQRRYLWANEPKIARDWADTYGSRIEKNDGGIMRTGFFKGAQADASAGKGSMSPGTSGSGGTHEGGYGRDQGNQGDQQGDMGTYKYKETKGDYLDKKIKEEFIQKSKKETKKKKPITTRLAEKHNAWKRKKWMENYMKKNPIGNPQPGKDRFSPDFDFENWTGDDWNNPENLKLLEEIGYNTHRPAGSGGGDGGGYMGYPSYEAWLAAQGAQGTGATGATGATTVAPISDFQKSLTGTVDTPGYYVGNDPTASNLAWGKQFGADPRTMGQTSWAANGGRIPAAFGGIMDSSTGRRAYGFGSIFKKIGRAAKKVFKSPIGKAALLGAGAYFGPMAFGQSAGFGSWGNIIPKKGFMANMLRKNIGTKALPEWGGLSPWKLGIMGASALPFFMGGQDEDEDEGFDYEGAKNKYRDELMRIKSGAMAGSLDPNQFNYLGVKDGGRIGLYSGGQSTPSDYTMEDARKTSMQDKMGGVTETMKRADLYRQGDVGQMYMAEGGLMDLGGMEKDYRNDGGFVPLGGEEKADDVPARLSKNEFVFTADAVRGAGGGDIDKGAEIMENIMKNLEQGGQISEETQGLSGAQEMFGVSERLSEVV